MDLLVTIFTQIAVTVLVGFFIHKALVRRINKSSADSLERDLKGIEFAEKSFTQLADLADEKFGSLKKKQDFLFEKTREAWLYSTAIKTLLDGVEGSEDTEEPLPEKSKLMSDFVDKDIDNILSVIEEAWQRDGDA
jgi:hypothetical protein